MPAIAIDFSDIPGVEPVPAGAYEVSIEKVVLRDSKSSDQKNIAWELRIADGGEYNGRPLFMNTSLSPKALWKLKGIMQSLGHDMDGDFTFDFDDETNLLVDPDLIETHAVARVSTDTYQNRQVNRVDDLTGIENGSLT